MTWLVQGKGFGTLRIQETIIPRTDSQGTDGRGPVRMISLMEVLEGMLNDVLVRFGVLLVLERNHKIVSLRLNRVVSPLLK